MVFVTAKTVVTELNIDYHTFYKFVHNNDFEYITLPSGIKRYNLEKFLNDNNQKPDSKPIIERKICYARVSSRGQKDDLERQVSYLKEKYPNHEIIQDISSGINFKRKGLKKIINYAIQGELSEIVIAYKDRLARIGFDVLEYIFKTYSNTNIIIENQTIHSPEEEVVQDLLQIITVFAARNNGLRKYKRQIKKDNINKK